MKTPFIVRPGQDFLLTRRAALALGSAFALAGFAGRSAAAGISISAPLSGQLGDKSFMDSANEGLQRAVKELGVTMRVVEAGADDAPAWERNLTEASASGAYNLIVTGGTVMASTLERVAAEFPDQKYLIFNSGSVGPNVTGIAYKQNEGAFLVGALAGLVTTNAAVFPRAKGSKKIGLVGGMDIPVIRDFAVGYEQGAKSIDPAITVDLRFIGDFESAQGAYDLTTAIYNAGADIVYQVAGAAGLGVLQAGNDSGRYAIGTDSDQNGLHPELDAGQRHQGGWHYRVPRDRAIHCRQARDGHDHRRRHLQRRRRYCVQRQAGAGSDPGTAQRRAQTCDRRRDKG